MGPSCTTRGPTVSSDTPVFIEGRVAMITSASFVSRSGKAERTASESGANTQVSTSSDVCRLSNVLAFSCERTWWNLDLMMMVGAFGCSNGVLASGHGALLLPRPRRAAPWRGSRHRARDATASRSPQPQPAAHRHFAGHAESPPHATTTHQPLSAGLRPRAQCLQGVARRAPPAP